MSPLSRFSFAVLLAAASAFSCLPALAQSTDAKPGDKPAEAAKDASKDAQRQVDEFAEATRTVTGPAGHPECVWLGRRVVGLMWRDDMDTAFRHLDLYDRFGCPGPHIQSAFRCVVRQSNNIDPKSPQSLNSRVHACWLNPTAQATAGAAGAPAVAGAPGSAPSAATVPPAAAAAPQAPSSPNATAGQTAAGTQNKDAR